MEDFKPTGTPEPPLSKARDWVNYSEQVRRETNTMPQWAGSCWYYLRFCDPKNSARFVGDGRGGLLDDGPVRNRAPRAKKPAAAWTSTSAELNMPSCTCSTRASGTRCSSILDISQRSEPFQRLVNQGIILGPDNQKMSKSRGNVVNPENVIAEYGADSLRLYEMFMGPLEQMKPWSMKGVEGVYRFLGRVFGGSSWRKLRRATGRFLRTRRDRTYWPATAGRSRDHQEGH